jgi:hypothetical protein
MNHGTAVAQGMAARYLLRELSDEINDSFERHLFDCPICAREVRDGAILAANARVLFQRERYLFATALNNGTNSTDVHPSTGVYMRPWDPGRTSWKTSV